MVEIKAANLPKKYWYKPFKSRQKNHVDQSVKDVHIRNSQLPQFYSRLGEIYGLLLQFGSQTCEATLTIEITEKSTKINGEITVYISGLKKIVREHLDKISSKIVSLKSTITGTYKITFVLTQSINTITTEGEQPTIFKEIKSLN